MNWAKVALTLSDRIGSDRNGRQLPGVGCFKDGGGGVWEKAEEVEKLEIRKMDPII